MIFGAQNGNLTRNQSDLLVLIDTMLSLGPIVVPWQQKESHL